MYGPKRPDTPGFAPVRRAVKGKALCAYPSGVFPKVAKQLLRMSPEKLI
jgi:hypothetical protein